MKKIFLSTFILIGSLVSCNDDFASNDEKSQNTITSFSRTELSNLSSVNKKMNDNKPSIYILSKIRSSNKNLDAVLMGLTITVDIVNKKAVFTKENEIGSIEYFLVEKENNLWGMTIANSYQNTHLRGTGWKEWLCAAGCVATGLSMSLLDGPAPVMDVAAALYVYTCTVDCNE